MPLYEYKCPNGHLFEVIHGMTEASPEVCEICGASPVRRVLFPVAVHYKGSGFYSTDYGRKGKKPQKDGALVLRLVLEQWRRRLVEGLRLVLGRRHGVRRRQEESRRGLDPRRLPSDGRRRLNSRVRSRFASPGRAQGSRFGEAIPMVGGAFL